METKSSRRRFQFPANETIFIFPEEDFIGEILSRLPVKSLLRFRCVSKSWRSLISSKYFIQLHLKNSNSATKRIISVACNESLINSSLQSLWCGLPVSDAVDFEYPIQNPKNSVRVVGCCNGIACIAINGEHLFLWNPSTRRYKKLPDFEKPQQGYYWFGFCFDEFSDDYNVVGILSRRPKGVRYDTRVIIYSVRNNSWRGIDVLNDSDSIHGNSYHGHGEFVNGKVHWVRSFGVESEWDIVSFDLVSETCLLVKQPRYGEIGFWLSLGVLEGCLCVLCDCEIWKMKEYGVRESWEKVATLPYLDDLENLHYLTSLSIPYLELLGLGSKGEIFLFYESSLMAYDPKDHSCKWSKLRNSRDFLFDARVCVESLVSLDGESDAGLETIVGLMG